MTTEPPPQTPRSRGFLSWKGILLFVIVGLFVGGAWIAHRIDTWQERTTDRVLKAFREVANFGPRVTVRDRVVFEQTKDALEIVVVTRETQVEREMEHEWLGSRKKIRLRGTYVVKAGYDLRERFAVEIKDRQIRVDLPEPKILSADVKDTEVLVLEDGLWNKIQPEDLEGELRALPGLARAKAEETGLPSEAKTTFTKRLLEQLTPAYEVEFVENMVKD